jgi:alkylated DNA repair dioxygenase AlkB
VTRPPEAVLEAARRVVASTGAPFNSVGLNHYRDGRDSVAPHNDHLDELVDGFPIALLSLGSTRRMAIRAKAPPRGPASSTSSRGASSS